MIKKIDDDEWIHSFDDEGLFEPEQEKIKDKEFFTLAKLLYGIGGFIAGWLAKVLADTLDM